MEIIAIASEKGGCGKTSTVTMLSNGLTALGYRVLMVDFDPSANLTGNTLPGTPDITIYDVFVDEEIEVTQAIYKASVADILPTNKTLRYAPLTPDQEQNKKRFVFKSSKSLTEIADMLKSGQMPGNPIELLKATLLDEQANLSAKYDFVVIDTPASDDILTRIALYAADRVIIPTTAVSDSVDCFMKCLSTIGMIQRQTAKNTPLIDGIALSLYPGEKKKQDQYACASAVQHLATTAERFNFHIYETRLRESYIVKDALTRNLPLLHDKYIFSGNPHAPEDAINFTLEFLGRKGMEPKTIPCYVKKTGEKWCWQKPAPKKKKKPSIHAENKEA